MAIFTSRKLFFKHLKAKMAKWQYLFRKRAFKSTTSLKNVQMATIQLEKREVIFKVFEALLYLNDDIHFVKI